MSSKRSHAIQEERGSDSTETIGRVQSVGKSAKGAPQNAGLVIIGTRMVSPWVLLGRCSTGRILGCPSSYGFRFVVCTTKL